MAGLIKLILLTLIATLAMQLWRRLQRPKSITAQPAEAMLPCVYCQTHIPKSEVIYYRDQAFCSKAHKQQYIDKR